MRPDGLARADCTAGPPRGLVPPAEGSGERDGRHYPASSMRRRESKNRPRALACPRKQCRHAREGASARGTRHVDIGSVAGKTRSGSPTRRMIADRFPASRSPRAARGRPVGAVRPPFSLSRSSPAPCGRGSGLPCHRIGVPGSWSGLRATRMPGDAAVQVSDFAALNQASGPSRPRGRGGRTSRKCKTAADAGRGRQARASEFREASASGRHTPRCG
jgi:hypothetical protein